MKDIPFLLGENNVGTTHVQLSKAPHILVAGMTGAGKSVLIHDLICQVIGSTHPTEMALVLVDPKRVEFARYAGQPHLALNPVYDEGSVESVLRWAVAEMNNRFDAMARRGIRDVTSADTPWPRLIVIVDELANLVLKGKQFSKPLVDIASMGRAAGVHLILATQRPDAKVIDGLIRANVPTRIALPTLTAADSRIILDQTGAEDIGIPQRIIRLPGQRDLILTEGRHFTDDDIDRVASIWR